ncbi:MAG: hypothetical protein OXE49_12350 [Gemmatimonadetes bacterium]|nr:hypothetical protein [Gemmatimonadota bacterium]
MNTAIRFILTIFSLLCMVSHVHADSVSAQAEASRAEVVLEADGIDSSTVEVGALAVVVYGQGERHPTSGEWAKLDTVRGYIKAVSQRRLIIGLEPDEWSKWIALERIQTLSLIESASHRSEDGDSKQAAYGRAVRGLTEPSDRLSGILRRRDDMEPGKRVAIKLASGAFKGVAAGLVGGVILLGIAAESQREAEPGTDPSAAYAIEGAVAAISGFCIGNTVGSAVGVSKVDPHDRFIMSLGGSVVGLIGSIGLTYVSGGALWPSLFVGPVVGATVMSELWRKPPEARRFSIGLVPNSDGNLSAVATLRF